MIRVWTSFGMLLKKETSYTSIYDNKNTTSILESI